MHACDVLDVTGSSSSQSLEFVAETRILAEMKIENRGKIYFPWKKNTTSILFFFEN